MTSGGESQGGKTLFCFGLGYSARRLADRLAARGWRVAGTVRNPGARELPPEWQIAGFSGDRPAEGLAEALAGTTHILSSIPPGGGMGDGPSDRPENRLDHRPGDPVLQHHRDAILRLPALSWIGYLSATSVYGDCAGAWVDETAPLRPTGRRGARRVATEQAWLQLFEEDGIPVHIFRLAGIYGPGRSALDRLRTGQTRVAVKDGQVFGRIHVDDIATALEASIARPHPGQIYNLCDDEPAPPQDVAACAARLLGVAAPAPVPLAEAGLSEAALSFYRDNRRVSNARIKKDLGVRLRWPTYREGLAGLAGDSAVVGDPATKDFPIKDPADRTA